MRLRLLPLLTAGLALAAPALGAEISLDQAIEAAVAHSPQVVAQEAAIDVARSERVIGRAHLRPVLQVTGDLKVWNQAQEVSFTGGGGGGLPSLPAPTTPYEAALAALLDGFSSPTRIQDQITAAFGASIMQPLTDLISTRSTREALALGLDVAQAARAEAARSAAVDAIAAWLRLHLALALERSASQSVQEYAPRLEQVDALLAGGAALQSDRLRLEVAQASAAQDLIAARAQVATAQSVLATLMGLSPEQADELRPTPVDTTRCKADTTSVDALLSRALDVRPELRGARASTRQAELGVDLARARMWPSVSAVAAYTHLEGQGLAVKDSAYVGLNLRWNAFEWGATREGITIARARSRQADQQLRALTDRLRMQIASAQQELRATAEVQGVAALAETQASESLRVESVRYGAGDATTTDVVTAEAALRRARDQRVAAGFRCLLARATLGAAVGDTLRASELFDDGEGAPLTGPPDDGGIEGGER
ncbi:MAG: TolC family protein [Deltaproteobacteria bacterium]|nr:TolC family protein [Deltaproteobacteria bacterium]MCB9787434.1 TolC family protein [Deltaproteobacteria bacterium]